MKRLLVALILLCAGYWGALNQAKLKSWWQEVEKKVGGRYNDPASAESASAPASAPEIRSTDPAPGAAPPPPTPPPAPTPAPLPPLEQGVYYTKERITQMTDNGIAAIPECTKVQLVEEQG